MSLSESIFSVVINLISSAIYDQIDSLEFFQKRKIKSHVESAVAEVVEPLLPFLENEGIPRDKQLRLVEICAKELSPLIRDKKALFQASLNGQKVFDCIYEDKLLPQVVVEDGLQDVYVLLCPRIAALLGSIAVATEDWQYEAWSENFRRLDDISDQIKALFIKVDELATKPTQATDELLSRVRRVCLQSIGFELDLSGLRDSDFQSASLDDIFVHPTFRTKVEIAGEGQTTHRYKDIEEGFESFSQPRSRAILIGQPGAGKSSWTKWFQQEAYSSRWTGLCIRVELRKLSVNSLPCCYSLIRDNISQHFVEDLTSERLSIWMREHRAIFVFDGFDEVRLSDRDVIHDWITDLSSFASSCPMVITSRPLTTNQIGKLPDIWRSWTIEPFDRSRIVQYVKRWYRHTDLVEPHGCKVDASVLADDWIRDPAVKPLTGNPLLLTTLLIVNHLDGSLPNGRAQLYRRYVEGMLGLWDNRRNVQAVVDVQISKEDRKYLLKRIALEMFFQQKEGMEEKVVMGVVADSLQKLKIAATPEQALTVLRERSGLIVGPGIYSFSHRSIMEYLIAETVWQGDQRDSNERTINQFYLFQHRGEDTWNAITFLWAGLATTADVESFIDQCVEAGQWDLAYGILYDQYERFNVSTRRRFIFDLLHAENQPPARNGLSFWGLSYMARDSKEVVLQIPSYKLRSLSSYTTSILSLFERVTKDGTVMWSDGADGRGRMRDLLWMCCIIDVREDRIEEWRTCIAASPPSRENEQAWLCWVAEHTIEDALKTNELQTLERVVELFQTYCPQHKALLPFALLSVGIGLYEHYFQDEDFYGDESYYRAASLQSVDAFMHVLTVLPGSNEGQTAEKLLAGTYRWIISLECGDTNEIDLLICFVGIAQRVADECEIKQHPSYHNALHFVERLKESRNSLTGKHPYISSSE